MAIEGVIQGVKIYMPSKDLKAHLDERAKHHQEKGEAYKKQFEQLEAIKEGEPREQPQSMDAGRDLQVQVHSHLGRVAYFKLLSKYLLRDATYELSMNDLRELEFYSKYGW